MTREEAYYILSLIDEGKPVTMLATKEACRIALNVFDELDELRAEIDGVLRTVEGWKKSI